MVERIVVGSISIPSQKLLVVVAVYEPLFSFSEISTGNNHNLYNLLAPMRRALGPSDPITLDAPSSSSTRNTSRATP